LGKGWENLCGEFRGFFSGFGNYGVTARREADQSGAFVVWIGEKFDEPLLLEAIDQNLDVLTRAESRPGDLGDGLGTVALKELKSSAASARQGCLRVRFEAIGQAVDFDE
jgi:hypothetical protein